MELARVSTRKLNNNECSIHGFFESAVTANPESIALDYADYVLTYRELDCRANFLASYLKCEQGVAAGNRVALHIERSIELIVGILAVLKCGAVYIPLNVTSPYSHNEKCIASADVRHIISDREDEPLHRGGRTHVWIGEKSLFERTLNHFESSVSSPDDCAYIIFTSGTTGDPKGVMVPHRAVLRLAVRPSYININTTDSILQLSPASFDASTFEIWGALLNGAKLTLYSGTVLDPNLLKKEIREKGVTILWLSAALFHLVADKHIDALRPLKVLFAGGDVLNPRVVRSVLSAVPGITVINGYGPTENTTFTCCHRMTANNLPERTVPIGSAISGTSIFVLDHRMQPVKSGEVGELYVGGDGVALGYVNDERNDSFFVDERVCTGLIYRTGDLVRENENHELEFLGRRDNQVKIRGYRVSLEEVQAQLLNIAGVEEAVVTTSELMLGDQLLIAHVQIEQDVNITPKKIRWIMNRDSPPHLVPDEIVLSPKLEITTNGKIRKIMPEKAEE